MLTTLRTRLAALPRDTRDTLFLLAVIGWVIVPHVGHLPFWCTVLAAGVLTWRGTLAVRSRPLPGRWWLLGLLAATLAATWLSYRTLLGRDPGVTLIVVLLALKTLELRARRDAFVIFFLGFFAMLTNFFFSQSLPLAVAMLIALLGLLTALVNAHMPVGRPPLAASARIAGRMALLGAPIMAVLFVLFPRFAPLWGMPGDAMAGRSGLASQVEVGTIASLALDDAIAMRVKFQGPTPPQSTLYFRGPVLTQFDGRQWRPLQPRLGAASGNFGQAQLQVSGEPVRYEMTLEPHNRAWLLTLDAPLRAPDAPGYGAMMTSELQWMSPRPITDLMRYRAESYTRFRHGPSAPAAVLPDYLLLPDGLNPRTQQLATELRQAHGSTDKQALVTAALARLRTGGYIYTLDPGVYGQHTADEFWFDRKQGFCEHIASAFIVLMRNLGIPARMVTGYQGGEPNSVDGYWVVRQSDAHAWAEVWLAGQGWVRVDPTAAVAPGRVGAFQRLQAPRGAVATAINTVNPTLAATLRSAWEAMNNGWNQWVLNYTQSKQLDVLRNLGFKSPSWEDLSYVLLVLVVCTAAIGAAWSWWEKSQHDPWLRLLHTARRKLRRSGVEVPASAPPRRIAQLVSTHFGDAGSAMVNWLLQMESQRYARDAAADLGGLRRALKRIHLPT